MERSGTHERSCPITAGWYPPRPALPCGHPPAAVIPPGVCGDCRAMEYQKRIHMVKLCP